MWPLEINYIHMKHIFYLLIIFLLSACHPYLAVLNFKSKEALVLKDEGFSAYMYLNQIRQDPYPYLDSMGIKDDNVKKRPVLLWNEKLAKVAEIKAADMAKRNYFSHQTPEGYGINRMMRMGGYKLDDWLKGQKRTNNFESIGAGVATGKGMVELLIIDEGVPSLGHRKHLLGMGKFHSSSKDIGIGMAYHPDSNIDTTA
jgi:uncharacterized protein YkwD